MSSDILSISDEVEKLETVRLSAEGDTVEGTVLKTFEVQAYSFEGVDASGKALPGKPLFWGHDRRKTKDNPNNDLQPVMQPVLTMDVGGENPKNLYITASLRKAFVNLAKETGKPVEFPPGAKVKVRRGAKGGGTYGNDVAYQVRVTPPSVSISAEPEKASAPKTATEEVPF